VLRSFVRARKRLSAGSSAIACAAALACAFASANALATGPFDAARDVAMPQSVAAATPAATAPLTSKPHQPALSKYKGNPLWAIPLGSMPATRERPLFSPSRRSPPVALAVPPAPPPPKVEAPEQPRLSLVGTVIGSAARIGVFTDQATKAVVRLRIGEGHDGWILHSIEEREATLERDRREVTLALPGRKGVGRTSPVPTAVAPQPSASLQAPPVRPPWPTSD
jgi:general secretion pathway protein N